MTNNKPLRVVFATPEAVPFAKTGGLADVAGALPKFLQPLGCDVRLVMPYYRMVKESGSAAPVPHVKRLRFPMGDETIPAEIYQGQLTQDVPVYFIGREEYFDRKYLYGTPEGDYFDNAERFIFFSRGGPHSLPAPWDFSLRLFTITSGKRD